PHNAENGSQLRATNVVVLKVKVTRAPLIDAMVVGTGEAIVASRGVVSAGRWGRAGLSDKTRLTDASGAPLALAPGSTWIHLVPEERPVTAQ
ncbi:MAG: DUF3048 C-terminal domain-containing protein, partial [Candidatus Methylomirabilales bacterium]